jgi:hypothetical protein
MKTHIALGAGLLLTLGTAVAGSIFYGQSGQSAQYDESTQAGQYVTSSEQYSFTQSAEVAQPAASSDASQPTPEMIAMWKATAASIDYIAPKAPI